MTQDQKFSAERFGLAYKLRAQLNEVTAERDVAETRVEQLEERLQAAEAFPNHTTFKLGDRVMKKSGSQWHGHVVGFYSTEFTPEGYAVESERERSSVQIYPAKALAAFKATVETDN